MKYIKTRHGRVLHVSSTLTLVSWERRGVPDEDVPTVLEIAEYAGVSVDVADTPDDPTDPPPVIPPGGTTPEEVRDLIGTTLRGVGLVQVTPDDTGDRVDVTTTATQNASDAQLRDRATHTGTQPVDSIAGFLEAVQDAVAAMLVSGGNITLTYDDTAGTVTVTGASGGDAEVMRDTIGAALVGVNGVGVAVNDDADTITVSVSGYEPALPAGGTASHFLRGDKTWANGSITQAEAEAGTAQFARLWTAERVRQAILAITPAASYDNVLAGTRVTLSWDGTNWIDPNGAVVTDRPTSRTNVYFRLVGGDSTVPNPAWMIHLDSRVVVGSA